MAQSLNPLIDISDRAHYYFTDGSGQTIAKLRTGTGFALAPVRSRQLRDWFFSTWSTVHDSHPTPHAFRSLLQYLEALADADPDRARRAVYRRVGANGDCFPEKIFLDLANPRVTATEMVVQAALPEGPHRGPTSGYLYFPYSGK